MLLGSARMVLETGKHPGELKDAVCSPGGSTIQGVRLLEERAFRGAVTDAVLAAFEKTKDLGEEVTPSENVGGRALLARRPDGKKGAFPGKYPARQTPDRRAMLAPTKRLPNRNRKRNFMRIVVKVGTSTLAHPGGLLQHPPHRGSGQGVERYSGTPDISSSSYRRRPRAPAQASCKLKKPGDLVTKQAAAAVGQCELMYTYDRLFGQYNHTVAQMLLTWEDFDHENRLHNLQNTLERFFAAARHPHHQRDDPVACEEYSLGDNDTLAALVAKCIHADLVVLMSDIDGLYTADPHTHPDAKLIPVVKEITPEIEMLAGGAGSALGTGGMLTKVTAAKRATEAGVDMIITNGAHAEVLYDIVEGKPVGTRFVGRKA